MWQNNHTLFSEAILIQIQQLIATLTNFKPDMRNYQMHIFLGKDSITLYSIILKWSKNTLTCLGSHY